MTKAYTTILTFMAVIVLYGCASPNVAETTDSFATEGQVRWVGNEPFARMVLTTTDGNAYVLIFDDVAQPAGDLGRYVVRGRLYASEFNGARTAHIKVSEISEQR